MDFFGLARKTLDCIRADWTCCNRGRTASGREAKWREAWGAMLGIVQLDDEQLELVKVGT